MTTMINAALVLEGGSLRCMFTSGVLDVFVEQGIEMSYVNGVSAGSMCGLNYIARHVGRNLEINTHYLHDRRYISMKNMLKKRLIFNFDFLFGELSHELVPFDYETFENSQQIFEAVATRCKTGKPEYFTKGKCSDIYKAVEASSSMPLLSRMVTLDGKKYLDGGISMPIAYERPMELGYDKIVLVLTREQGYRKHQEGRWMKRAYDRYFEPLPSLRQSLRDIPERYNRIQEELDRLEAEGRIFIIRPDRPVEVSRLEQDVHKIQALYDEGRRIALEQLPALKNYLELPQ